MGGVLSEMAQRLRRVFIEGKGPRPGLSGLPLLRDEHHLGPQPGEHGRPMDRALDAGSFTALLSGLGYANPMEPLLMLEAFLSSGAHLTVAEFGRVLKKRGFDAAPDKAAGALELFTALGLAEKMPAEDGRIIYEHTHPGLHHDHLICSDCGQAVEFNRPDVDGLIETIAADEGFTHLRHNLTVYGLCPECRRRRRSGLPLSGTAVGESVVVVSFNGSETLKNRLTELGLRRGSRLRILGGQSGSVIVLLDGCRLAMGPEMAEAVIVRALHNAQPG
ncbi:MAG: transcriptional repressor [Candidatus Adiutrix sp.]|jgi:Fur family ferric uptake transcriptional regulator|nr:transcriptional repressor [Candidatus Adiutrix sp.]